MGDPFVMVLLDAADIVSDTLKILVVADFGYYKTMQEAEARSEKPDLFCTLKN